METDLKALRDQSLFEYVVMNAIPFSKTEPIDFNEVGRIMFKSGTDPKFRERVWPVLRNISNVGLENVPDMMGFLPLPSDPEFPAQCLGLQMLLDQGPRLLCKDIDGRWTNSYFDQISYKLATGWLSLPLEQRPDTWARWRDLVSLDYWITLRFKFGAPFVHNDTRQGQMLAEQFTEETRATVEQVTGQADPNRRDRESILTDIYGLERMVTAGAPQGDDITAASWCFWMGKLMDVHKAIVDRFGRYPYRNAIQGLESTEDEKRWLEETNHFGEAPPDVARRVREDVEAGRWTPLREA
ncbi:hypothetical protein DL765_004278 [Monosporascus sp. GIB2]|nr:hypothetical protein DL765_004278 [Monosporascus sp. GIB2]